MKFPCILEFLDDEGGADGIDPDALSVLYDAIKLGFLCPSINAWEKKTEPGVFQSHVKMDAPAQPSIFVGYMAKQINDYLIKSGFGIVKMIPQGNTYEVLQYKGRRLSVRESIFGALGYEPVKGWKRKGEKKIIREKKIDE